MSVISEKIANDVLLLPIESKLELIDSLLKSLNIPTKSDIDELWARGAEQRIDELNSGSTQLVDGPEFSPFSKACSSFFSAAYCLSARIKARM